MVDTNKLYQHSNKQNMSREINTIVLHHSVTPRDLEITKSIKSFDNNHKERLHSEKNSLGYHIAYHYVIAGNGDVVQTRADDEIGYHASNWEINKTSIGICLTGNFDEETPSDDQMEVLRELIADYQSKFTIEKIIGHNEVPGVTKSCPGKNFSTDFSQDLVFEKYKKWAVASKLCNDENWNKTMSKQEIIKVLNSFTKYIEEHSEIKF